MSNVKYCENITENPKTINFFIYPMSNITRGGWINFKFNFKVLEIIQIVFIPTPVG